MAEVRYREAREAEIPEAVEVFIETVADMYARHGVGGAPLPERAFVEGMYRYIQRTGIFHVAEAEGRIAAICHAVVRDSLWFLSGFWVLPALQRRKIGMPLLKRVWAEGAQMGARTFFTWSSIDPTAMASYMKLGMLPGYQLLTFAGPPVFAPREGGGYETRPLTIETAAALDSQIRATTRTNDHQFWLGEAGLVGRSVLLDGGTIGYYYYNTQGAIGPAAWSAAAGAGAFLDLASREAAAHAQQIRLAVPGINHAAIRFALQSGLRLTSYSHLLTTAPFGRMEQYIPSGPSLF